MACQQRATGPAGLTHELDGRTTLSLVMELTSQEARDMVLNSGMEAGMQAGWDLIEQIARSLD